MSAKRLKIGELLKALRDGTLGIFSEVLIVTALIAVGFVVSFILWGLFR